jgi:capsule polysaccharide export protein KpsE/RkpR
MPIVTERETVGAAAPNELEQAFQRAQEPNWLANTRILWLCRGLLLRVGAFAFLIGMGISLVIPKMYVSHARIMPPDSSKSSAALITALAGHSLGSELLGGLAAGLMGGYNSGALFTDLLRSDSVTGAMIARFDLQKVYGKRYREDAAKVLLRRTDITQDKKSGVITIAVKDHDPRRASDMAQAYLEELNAIVNRTSRSSAHQERVFIEKRLTAVKADLEKAQNALSEFSGRHSTVDLGTQTKATVESMARVQGELIVAEGDLESLEQIYGNGNVRVRAAEARVGSLKRELEHMGGSSAPMDLSDAKDSNASGAQRSASAESYLPLRQVPRLAVPYANLYREVHVQEAVYDLLTQQYEVARIQEAKDVPAVNVIDAPGIPEKKAWPPRAVVTIALTGGILLVFALYLIWQEHWLALDSADPRRSFAAEVARTARGAMARLSGRMEKRA